jgi:hypothetical protein
MNEKFNDHPWKGASKLEERKRWMKKKIPFIEIKIL